FANGCLRVVLENGHAVVDAVIRATRPDSRAFQPLDVTVPEHRVQSLVVAVRHPVHRVWLTGDVGPIDLRALIRRLIPRAVGLQYLNRAGDILYARLADARRVGRRERAEADIAVGL